MGYAVPGEPDSDDIEHGRALLRVKQSAVDEAVERHMVFVQRWREEKIPLSHVEAAGNAPIEQEWAKCFDVWHAHSKPVSKGL